MSVIKVYQCDNCDHWHVVVGEVHMFTCDDEGPAKRIARIFDKCRNTSHREAMRMITEDIGYDGVKGAMVYEMLITGKSTEAPKRLHS